MPKTIAITPSWYWPEGTQRVVGIPPFGVHELCVSRPARDREKEIVLTDGRREIDAAGLRDEVARLAPALREAAGAGGRLVLPGELSVEGVVLLLSSLAAGVHARVLSPGEDASAAGAGARFVGHPDELNGGAAPADLPQGGVGLKDAAISIPGEHGDVCHSHRSLIADAIALATFLDVRGGRPWLAALPLSRWEGLLSVLLPLYAGATLVLGSDDPEEYGEAIAQHDVGYAVHDLETASWITREARKSVKRTRGVLDAMLVSTGQLFDPGDRQRVTKSFQSPALTFFGMPETGLIFASHPSWYLDESVGIPVTNAHVVPSDPRSGAPIQTLWELVESAEVTMRGPQLMCGYSAGEAPERFVDGRFRTGVIASSDANGMIYLLPD